MEPRTQCIVSAKTVSQLMLNTCLVAAALVSPACLGAVQGETVVPSTTVKVPTNTEGSKKDGPANSDNKPNSPTDNAAAAPRKGQPQPPQTLWQVVGTKKPTEGVQLLVTPKDSLISLWDEDGTLIYRNRGVDGLINLPTDNISPGDLLEVTANGHGSQQCAVETCLTALHLSPLEDWQRVWQRASFRTEPSLDPTTHIMQVRTEKGHVTVLPTLDGSWRAMGTIDPLANSELLVIEAGGDAQCLSRFTSLEELDGKTLYPEGQPEIESALYFTFSTIHPLIDQKCNKAPCRWPSNLFVESLDGQGNWQALSRPSQSNLENLRWGPISLSNLRKTQIRVSDISGAFKSSAPIQIRYIQTRNWPEGPEDSRLFTVPSLDLKPSQPSLHIALLDSEQLAIDIERSTRRSPSENLLPRMVDLYLGQVKGGAYSIIDLQRVDGTGQLQSLNTFKPDSAVPTARQVEQSLGKMDFYQSSVALGRILSKTLEAHDLQPWTGAMVLVLEVLNRQDLKWQEVNKQLRALKRRGIHPIIVIYGPVKSTAEAFKKQVESEKLGTVLIRNLKEDGLDGHFLSLTESLEVQLKFYLQNIGEVSP